MSGSTAFSSPDTVSILSQLAPAPASLMERIERPGLPPDRLVAALSASLGDAGEDGPPATPPTPSSPTTFSDGMPSEAVGAAAAAAAATAQARPPEHLPVPLPRVVWREDTDGDGEAAISPVLAGGLVGLGAGLVVTLGLYIASGGSNSVFWPAAPAAVVQASAVPAQAAIELVPSPIRTIGVATTEERTEPRDTGREALKLAERLIAQGDIAGAREILARVAAEGTPLALLSLAETYDPNVLAAWGVRSAEADTERARHLYTSALVAGVEQARRRLETLD